MFGILDSLSDDFDATKDTIERTQSRNQEIDEDISLYFKRLHEQLQQRENDLKLENAAIHQFKITQLQQRLTDIQQGIDYLRKSQTNQLPDELELKLNETLYLQFEADNVRLEANDIEDVLNNQITISQQTGQFPYPPNCFVEGLCDYPTVGQPINLQVHLYGTTDEQINTESVHVAVLAEVTDLQTETVEQIAIINNNGVYGGQFKPRRIGNYRFNFKIRGHSLRGFPAIVQVRPIEELNFLVIGDSSTGKSSLIETLTKGHFDANHQPTNGSCQSTVHLRFNDQNTTIHFWEVSGKETQIEIVGRQVLRKGFHCCLMVFDSSNRKSLEKLVELQTNYCKAIANRKYTHDWSVSQLIQERKSVIWILIANKSDLSTETITVEQIRKAVPKLDFDEFVTMSSLDVNSTKEDLIRLIQCVLSNVNSPYVN